MVGKDLSSPGSASKSGILYEEFISATLTMWKLVLVVSFMIVRVKCLTKSHGSTFCVTHNCVLSVSIGSWRWQA
ncbi:unnamed protein product [Urochloa humidicola]